ncbi:MAG: Gfo/Idh/MocA family oxidoreductase [Phycisphaerae bacterium]|nr:Gfo/Idh/MocA family oxidoreductase [Phycisphaerae bacterium]
MTTRKRYAQIGLGGRHVMFRDAVLKDFTETSEMVAMCDNNKGRLDLSLKQIREEFDIELPGYSADDFEKMIAETKPDCIIVTTRDNVHHEYICRAMELGCDVITEKPMTIDEQKCRQILEVQRKTGKNCKVTFNYRYSPPRSQIKEMLMDGVIGEVLSVDFQWMLNTSHGADYFRRWHRNKVNSGGLMVHKATHHFDLVNWWLSTVPQSVYASGHRRFYTPKTGDRYGLTNRSERCHDCPDAEKCRFRLDMAGNDSQRHLYLECEQYDGYHRDQCVFSDKIDIEDSMNVVVNYENGAKMAYSLNAFNPWEGYVISFNGTKGRIEHKCQETVYTNADGSVPGEIEKEGTWTRIFPHWQVPYEIELWTGTGGHGGGDPVMLADIFDAENQEADKFLRAADQRSGAYSILTGIAANHSMAEGRPVQIDELVQDIGMPDYPAMPTDEAPLPMPQEEAKEASTKE